MKRSAIVRRTAMKRTAMKRAPMRRKVTRGATRNDPPHTLTRKALVREIERLHPIYIRVRDDHRCVVCHRRKPQIVAQCGHLFSRISRSTRWDVLADGNCHCQCSGCNMRHEHDPYPYMRWYVAKFGMQALDAMRLRYNTVKVYTYTELCDLLQWLRDRIPAHLQERKA